VAESRRHARVLNVVCRARGGIVDNVETRRIINALVADSGGINIAQAHEQLERLLGNQYDAERWGKLFNHVVCEPGRSAGDDRGRCLSICSAAGGVPRHPHKAHGGVPQCQRRDFSMIPVFVPELRWTMYFLFFFHVSLRIAIR
jgi:hypothetical protein